VRQDERVLYGVLHRIVPPLLRAVWRPHVVGLDRVPRTGPLILASNHQSFIDSVVIPAVTPRPVNFLAKSDYFQGRGIRGRLVKEWFETFGALPIDRNDSMSAIASLDVALGVLAAGGAFGIYPEGTRSRDGRLARGKTGVAWLALTADCPVVPVAVHGTDRVQPVDSRWPRPHKVSVTFGEPLTFPEQRGMARNGRARRVVTDRIMEAIAELSGQEKADWGKPRA